LLAATSPVYLASVQVGLGIDLLLVVLALLDGVRTGREPRLQVSRSTASHVSTGAEAAVEVTIRSETDRPIAVRVTDDLPPAMPRIREPDADLQLRSRGTGRWAYTLRADQRGRHSLGPVHLRVRGQMGLVWMRRRFQIDTAVQVQPGLDDLRQYRLLAVQHRLRDLGLRASRLRGQAGAFESLREYIRGDDPRHIEWKSSARHRRMVVRQYEVERSQNVMIALDLGRTMTEEIGEGRSRLDHALSAALLLAYVAGMHQDRVGLFAFADTVQVFLPPSRIGIDRLADVLTDVRGRMVEPHYPQAFSRLGQGLKRRSLVVLFTDVIDPGASRSLLAHLAPSARRHLPLVVAMKNPQIETAATSGARTDRALAERAAAEELLDQRARTLAAMRRTGVLVADTQASDAAPEVVNSYLDVKRRALL